MFRKTPGLGQVFQGYQAPCQITAVQFDGLSRKIDDFQPRKMLHQMYKENEISLADESSIDEFCKKFIIEKEIIKKFIEHIKLLDIKKRRGLRREE